MYLQIVIILGNMNIMSEELFHNMFMTLLILEM